MTKTKQIFKLTAPYANPYQGSRTRLLFVCSVGLLRSPTAAAVGIERGYNTRSCGSNTNLALIPLSANLIEWAETIVFVNLENYQQSLEEFAGTGYEEDIEAKSNTMNIPDNYAAFDLFLIGLINSWFDKWEVANNAN